MDLLRTALVATLLFTLHVTTLPAGDWPQWRGPNRDGHAAETNMTDDWNEHPPKLEWTMEGLGKGYASVAIVDGMLYTTGNTERGQAVIAVDLDSHKVKWSQPLTENAPKHGYPGSRSTPTVDGDRLYVVSSDGQIVCLQTSDGKIVWHKNFQREWNGQMMSGWGFSESPLIDGDAVLCTPGGPNAMIVKLDKQTGKEIWRAKSELSGDQGKDGAGYSSIVVSNGAGIKQYVQMTGRGVIGVRADDGQYLWGYNKVANPTANIPTPIVSGDLIFASSGYGDGGAVLLNLSKSGRGVNAKEVRWIEKNEFQNHHGGMILVGDYIYAGHGHGKGFPTCIELKTGEIVWGGSRNRGPGDGSAAISYADGQVIYRYQDGTLALVGANPKEYQLNGTFKPEYQEDNSWAHPVVVDGKLYLREQDKLMVYDVSER